MDADRIVRDFCALWSKGDLEGIIDAFTEDAVYHNIPMAPCRGKDEIRTFIGGLLGPMASSVDFDIKHQLCRGRIVMNERIDTIVMGDVMGDKTIRLPVCGIFELTEEGRISSWRDYFDAAQFAGA